MQVISDNLMYSATCFYASQGGGESGGGMSGVFPDKKLTVNDVVLYQSFDAMKNWLETPSDKVEYMVYDEGSLIALDKDVETFTTYFKIIWKFPEPVTLKSVEIKCANYMGRLYATNNVTACANAWDSWTFSTDSGEILLKNHYGNRTVEEVEINATNKYQYFYLSSNLNGSPDFYEIALKTE